MSGARTASTTTPPQTRVSLEPQTNGESPQVAVIIQPDDLSRGAAIVGRPGLSGPSTALAQNPSLHRLLQPHHHPQFWSRGLSLILESSLFLGTL